MNILACNWRATMLSYFKYVIKFAFNAATLHVACATCSSVCQGNYWRRPRRIFVCTISRNKKPFSELILMANERLDERAGNWRGEGEAGKVAPLDRSICHSTRYGAWYICYKQGEGTETGSIKTTRREINSNNACCNCYANCESIEI